MLLYIRMGVTLLVSLYTSRIVLNSLGVEDYGISNLVGGIVAMATFVTGSLASASQRFITFELGKGDRGVVKRVFATSLVIHIAIAALIIMLSETVGLWALNYKLNIPADRIVAANWVLQCSVLSFAVNILSVPYNALIISHERMDVFAYISILEAGLKLSCAFLLLYLPFDKLILYAILWLLAAIIVRTTYTLYCKKNYEESRVRFMEYDSVILKKMTGFAGYNFIEIAANIINKQGANFILNIFFGPVLNAARGISMQVNSIIDGFVTSFTTALNPQITKAYASNNRKYMLELVEKGSKYSFLLFLALVVPILVSTEGILKLWLKLLPDYVVIFVQLILIDSLIELMTRTFYTVISATGNIKMYQIIIGCFKLLNLPLCLLTLKILAPLPEYIYLVSILFTLLIIPLKFYFLGKEIEFSKASYIKNVIAPCIVVAVIALAVPFYFFKTSNTEVFDIFRSAGISFLYGVIAIYLFGLDRKEKKVLKNFILEKIS